MHLSGVVVLIEGCRSYSRAYLWSSRHLHTNVSRAHTRLSTALILASGHPWSHAGGTQSGFTPLSQYRIVMVRLE